jgi:hypothetical protein
MRFLKRIWNGVKRLYNRLVNKSRELVPVAINIVEGVKVVVDSPVDDIVAALLKKAIPGVKDDIIIEKIHGIIVKQVPLILSRLLMIDSISNIKDPNEQLQAIVKQLRISSDEQKNFVYHGLATLILEKLSDGKLTWGEAVMISEYYYQNNYKK